MGHHKGHHKSLGAYTLCGKSYTPQALFLTYYILPNVHYTPTWTQNGATISLKGALRSGLRELKRA